MQRASCAEVPVLANALRGQVEIYLLEEIYGYRPAGDTADDGDDRR